MAVTDLSLFMVRVQVAEVPVQAPDQPIHGEPGSGVAVSVTTVPAGYEEAAGLAVTVPLPFFEMLIL